MVRKRVPWILTLVDDPAVPVLDRNVVAAEYRVVPQSPDGGMTGELPVQIDCYKDVIDGALLPLERPEHPALGLTRIRELCAELICGGLC